MPPSARIARVAPFTRTAPRQNDGYDYLAPDGPISVGMLVRIPFGERTLSGMIVALPKKSFVPAGKMKRIESAGAKIAGEKDIAFALGLARVFWEPAGLILKQLASVRKYFGAFPLDDAPRRNAGKTHSFRAEYIQDGDLDRLLSESISVPALFLVPEKVYFREMEKRCRALKVPLRVFSQTGKAAEKKAFCEALAARSPGAYVSTHAGIFLPGSLFGRIAVVEASLPSHRQWDMHPRYDARPAAAMLAKTWGLPLAIHSSLPHLAAPISSKDKPPAAIAVSYHDAQSGAPLADDEAAGIIKTIRAGGRALVFNTIRGGASRITCTRCGFLAECPRCGARLAVKGRHFSCPDCGYLGPSFAFCPQCKSPDIGARRIGNEALSEFLASKTLAKTFVFDGSLKRSSGAAAGDAGIIVASERIFSEEDRFAGAFDRIVIASADEMLDAPDRDGAEGLIRIAARLEKMLRKGGALSFSCARRYGAVKRIFGAGLSPAGFIESERELAQKYLHPPFASWIILEKQFKSQKAARTSLQKQITLIKKDGQASAVSGLVLPRKNFFLVRILVRIGAGAESAIRAPSGWTIDPEVPVGRL